MDSGSLEERSSELTVWWGHRDQLMVALLLFGLSVFNWFEAESMLSA